MRRLSFAVLAVLVVALSSSRPPTPDAEGALCPAPQTSPFLSSTTSYGAVCGVGTVHSLNCSVFVSNMPILPP